MLPGTEPTCGGRGPLGMKHHSSAMSSTGIHQDILLLAEALPRHLLLHPRGKPHRQLLEQVGGPVSSPLTQRAEIEVSPQCSERPNALAAFAFKLQARQNQRVPVRAVVLCVHACVSQGVPNVNAGGRASRM